MVLLLIIFNLGARLHAQPASLPRADFWVTDGPVNAVVETNGVVYVGGQFDYISPVSETGCAFDPVSGSILPDFPKFNGAIKAIAPDQQGGWFVGGLFTAVDGLALTNLAHIQADMTVDTNWAPNPDGTVLAMAIGPALLYVGGTFTSLGGQSRSLLAALDPASGTVVQNWRADAVTTFPRPSVNALVLSGATLYVGGYFSFINGVGREHLGAVQSDTGQVTPWFHNGYAGSQGTSQVDALAILGQVLFVAGTFTSIGNHETIGSLRNYIAALDTTRDLGESVLPWDASANGPVTSIVLSCDTVYVGGSFTSIGGQPRNRIAALDMASGQATAWNPDANGVVLSVHLAGYVLFAGGKFSRIGGQSRNFLAALDPQAGQATLWNPKADFGVAALSISSGAVVAGGALGPGGKPRQNAAAFDARTGRPMDWSPVVAGETIISGAPVRGVYALAASSDTVYLGGPFTSINGNPRNHAGAVHATTGALLPWNPNPSGSSGIVEALAVAGNVIYAGGRFRSIGGASRTNLAALDAITGNATSWNPNPNDKVKTIVRQGNLVYAGGLFTRIGGQSRNRLAALDATSATATAWNPNVNDQVSAVAILGNALYLGGQFYTVGGLPRQYLASVSLAGTGPVTCWDPSVSFGVLSPGINTVFAYGNAIYAGGTYSQIAGQSRDNLAAVSTVCPVATIPWAPRPDAPVHALAMARDTVFVGGMFDNVGGRYRPHFAVFPPEGSPSIVRHPRGHLVGIGESVTFSAEATGTAPLAYQWQLDGADIPGATSPTFTLASAQVDDAGEYTVVVTNALSLVNSRPATLTVIQPLTIVVQPMSQTVAPGATVTLSVGIIGAPPPIYQWRLNGANIPGAIYPTLTLSSAQPADGGSYQVVVANITGAVSSEVAAVEVTSPALTLADALDARGTLTGALGAGSGSNAGASKVSGESNHAGRFGGRSVWMGWVAPSNGIARFQTRGSSFDTLLAVYTNDASLNPQPSMSSLVPVAADDDRGGFYTSQAEFNAETGTEYLIAVDGFSACSGNIVLSWDLDTSTVPFPRILSQPVSQTVTPGQTATFSVAVLNTNSVSYQWYFGCLAIPEATRSNLTIPNVQAENVGLYHVVVMNASIRAAISEDTALEIGPDARVQSQDKVEEVSLGGGGAALAAMATLASVPTVPFVSVSVGTSDAQLFANTGAGVELGEPNHCGVLGGASRSFDLGAEADAVMVVDTLGSRIDTVLAVYKRVGLLSLANNRVACDNNGAPDGIRSWVRFDARAGQVYRAYVDGVNGAEGEIQLHWKMGHSPRSAVPPSSQTVRRGEALTLRAEITDAECYQWFWNGKVVAEATNATLVFSNVQPSHGGTYSVLAESEFGSTNCLVATLTVDIFYLTIEVVPTNGMVRIQVEAPPGQEVVFEASTDVLNWTAFATNVVSLPPLHIEVPTASAYQKFIRARTRP